MLYEKNPFKELESLFNPKSIAVIGASNSTDKIGGFIFKELHKTKGAKVYPINISSTNVQGEQAYPSITHLKKKVDLAIVVIPGNFVVDTVEEIAKTGCKNIVIISAGFKEIGEVGIVREQQLKHIISKYSLHVIGPNCLGILHTKNSMNASFARTLPLEGGVGLVSQSGAVIDAILDWSFEVNVGFSKVVSIGNMAGIDELDMLRFFEKDPNTSTIVYYMETLEKGKEFAKELEKVTKKKPVIIIKPGTSKQAQKAIGSHTGSLAQDSKLIFSLLEHHGAILVNNYEELLTLLLATRMKTPTSSSVAIVTNAGGPGVISSDLLATSELELAELSPKLQTRLSRLLPTEASVKNPIDILGDGKSDRYGKVLQELCSSKEIKNIIVLLTPQIMTDSLEIAKEIVKFQKKTSKTILPIFLGGRDIKEAIEYFHHHNLPTFPTLHQGIFALNKLFQWYQCTQKKSFSQTIKVHPSLQKIRALLEHKQGLLDFTTTQKILSYVDITLPKKIVLETKQDILQTHIGDIPHVLKVEGIVHKKEENAVITHITQNQFQDIALEMLEKHQKPLTLEPQVTGHEAYIGLKNSGDLGNFIFFGTGGSYISVYEDISLMPCPITKEQAKQLVSKTKISKILNGIRGDKPCNLQQLYSILHKISFLLEIVPEIKEVDINPIICNEEECVLVDVKLLV
jgi:acetyltransferase